MKKILLGLLAILGLVLTLGSEDAFKSSLFQASQGQGNGESVTLSYVEWDTEVASTNVIAEVLRREGYDVTITPLDNAIMWSAVASGEADAMVGAWLPQTHGPQFDQYGDQMEDLGPNLKGAKIGMVVPSYMDVDSIADLSNQAGSVITGIEPGAGVMMATEEALASYPNLANWDLQSSSSGAMTTALGQAIDNEEEIVVTGWSPHWKFQAYDLKYLADPEGVYGGEETINTMVRQGLKEDQPRLYQILDQFNWTLEDMEQVMLAVSDGQSPQEAAAEWVDNHPDKVAEWLAE
ncbi:glycine/betaine ABC transporter substrate-binding protein [Aerococcus urinaehominis]|uniref:Glycine/betaine ABC transporter substrate-binding protein n=1 Tax=Aerococcus urinaehominis TaxID=128944 RepID=A0A0X8FL14_9LACT|nr:glycine/betaine ABC transporter substrate-binding protein [Aerococcus urinaehominis]SDM46633.1 glycine betaine/proline transport system substrate-binding protein [Aerococcus urinaehominis]